MIYLTYFFIMCAYAFEITLEIDYYAGNQF